MSEIVWPILTGMGVGAIGTACVWLGRYLGGRRG